MPFEIPTWNGQFSISYFRKNCRNRHPSYFRPDEIHIIMKWKNKNTVPVTQLVFFLSFYSCSVDSRQLSQNKFKKNSYGPLVLCINAPFSRLLKQNGVPFQSHREGLSSGTNDPLLHVNKRKVSSNVQKKILLEKSHSKYFYPPPSVNPLSKNPGDAYAFSRPNLSQKYSYSQSRGVPPVY